MRVRCWRTMRWMKCQWSEISWMYLDHLFFFSCRRKMNGTYQAHNGPLNPSSRKSKEGAEKLVLYIVWSKHGPIYVFVYTGWSDSPRGRISAERSKISKGILAFSRRIPRKRPPRPAPAMSTRGGLSVNRGGKSLALDPVEGGSVFVVLSNEALMLELAWIEARVVKEKGREEIKFKRERKRKVEGQRRWCYEWMGAGTKKGSAR